jgi:8-oxo-dGTP pyrophosphatase MutT (NUDIX family)
MSDPPPDARPDVVATPAATVVPLRDGQSGLEVLILRRNSRGEFGGMWVFPGGQVDPADLLVGADHGAEAAEIAAGRRAAVREAEEEAGLVLDVDRLIVLSFWLPPAGAVRRFATWFYLAPTTGDVDVVVDDHEIHEHRWTTPQDAMDRRNRGEIELAPPTYMTLWWLAQRADSAAALAAAAARPPERFETHIASVAGRPWACLWAGDAGYDDADEDRPGPRRRLIMDPEGWRVDVSG